MNLRTINLYLISFLVIVGAYFLGQAQVNATIVDQPPSFDVLDLSGAQSKQTATDFAASTFLRESGNRLTSNNTQPVEFLKFSNRVKLERENTAGCELIADAGVGKPNFIWADEAMTIKELFESRVKADNANYIFAGFGLVDNREKFNMLPSALVSGVNTEFCCRAPEFDSTILSANDAIMYFTFEDGLRPNQSLRCVNPPVANNPETFSRYGWNLKTLKDHNFLNALSQSQRLDSVFKINDLTGGAELIWPIAETDRELNVKRAAIRSQKLDELNGLISEGLYWVYLTESLAPRGRIDRPGDSNNILDLGLSRSESIDCNALSSGGDTKIKIESESDYEIMISKLNFQVDAAIAASAAAYKYTFFVQDAAGLRKFEVDATINNEGTASVDFRNIDNIANLSNATALFAGASGGVFLESGAELDLYLQVTIPADNDIVALTPTNFTVEAVNRNIEIGADELFIDVIGSMTIVDSCPNVLNVRLEGGLDFTCDAMKAGTLNQSLADALVFENRSRNDADVTNIIFANLTDALSVNIANLDADNAVDAGGTKSIDLDFVIDVDAYKALAELNADGDNKFPEINAPELMLNYEFGGELLDVGSLSLNMESCFVDTVTVDMHAKTVDGDGNALLSCSEENIFAAVVENISVFDVDLATLALRFENDIDVDRFNLRSILGADLQSQDLEADQILFRYNADKVLGAGAEAAYEFALNIEDDENRDPLEFNIDEAVLNDGNNFYVDEFAGIEVSEFSCNNDEFAANVPGVAVMNFLDEFSSYITDLFSLPTAYAYAFENVGVPLRSVAPDTLTPEQVGVLDPADEVEIDCANKMVNVLAVLNTNKTLAPSATYSVDYNNSIFKIYTENADGEFVVNGDLNLNVPNIDYEAQNNSDINLEALPFGVHYLAVYLNLDEFGQNIDFAKNVYTKPSILKKIDNTCVEVQLNVSADDACDVEGLGEPASQHLRFNAARVEGVVYNSLVISEFPPNGAGYTVVDGGGDEQAIDAEGTITINFEDGAQNQVDLAFVVSLEDGDPADDLVLSYTLNYTYAEEEKAGRGDITLEFAECGLNAGVGDRVNKALSCDRVLGAEQLDILSAFLPDDVVSEVERAGEGVDRIGDSLNQENLARLLIDHSDETTIGGIEFGFDIESLNENLQFADLRPSFRIMLGRESVNVFQEIVYAGVGYTYDARRAEYTAGDTRALSSEFDTLLLKTPFFQGNGSYDLVFMLAGVEYRLATLKVDCQGTLLWTTTAGAPGPFNPEEGALDIIGPALKQKEKASVGCNSAIDPVMYLYDFGLLDIAARRVLFNADRFDDLVQNERSYFRELPPIIYDVDAYRGIQEYLSFQEPYSHLYSMSDVTTINDLCPRIDVSVEQVFAENVGFTEGSGLACYSKSLGDGRSEFIPNVFEITLANTSSQAVTIDSIEFAMFEADELAFIFPDHPGAVNDDNPHLYTFNDQITVNSGQVSKITMEVLYRQLEHINDDFTDVDLKFEDQYFTFGTDVAEGGLNVEFQFDPFNPVEHCNALNYELKIQPDGLTEDDSSCPAGKVNIFDLKNASVGQTDVYLFHSQSNQDDDDLFKDIVDTFIVQAQIVPLQKTYQFIYGEAYTLRHEKLRFGLSDEDGELLDPADEDGEFSNLFLMNYEPVVVDVPPIAECEALEVVLEYQEVESCELPRNTFASLNLTSAQAVNLRNISFDLNYEGGLGLLFPLEFSLLHDGDVIATSLGTDNISFDLEDQEPPPGFLINGEDGLDLEIAIKYPPYALAKLISFEDLVINGQEISFGEGSVHSIAAGRMAGAFDFFDIPGSVSTILQADDSISSLDFEEFFGVLNAITYNASFCVQSSLLAANADATEFEGPLTFRNTGKYPMLLTKLFASVQVPYRIHTKSRAIYTINKVDTSGQPGISKSAVSIWLAGEDLAVEQNGVVEQPSNTYIDFLRVIYEIHIEQLKNLHLECNLANAAVNVHNCGLKSRFQVTDLEYFTNSGYFYIPGQSTTMFAHPISWYPNFDLDSYQTLPAGKKQDFKCTITDFTEARQDEGFEEALQELMFAQGQLNLDFDWDLDGLMGDNDSYPFTDQPDAAEDIAEGLIDSFYAGIFDEDSDNWLELDENIILALESTLSFSKRGSQIIVDTPGGEIPSFNAGDFRGDADAAACIGLPAVLEDEESDFYIDRIRPIEYQPPREEDDSDFNIEPLDIEPAEPDFSNASRTDLNLDSIDIEQPEREVPGPPLDL